MKYYIPKSAFNINDNVELLDLFTQQELKIIAHIIYERLPIVLDEPSKDTILNTKLPNNRNIIKGKFELALKKDIEAGDTVMVKEIFDSYKRRNDEHIIGIMSNSIESIINIFNYKGLQFFTNILNVNIPENSNVARNIRRACLNNLMYTEYILNSEFDWDKKAEDHLGFPIFHNTKKFNNNEKIKSCTLLFDYLILKNDENTKDIIDYCRSNYTPEIIEPLICEIEKKYISKDLENKPQKSLKLKKM